jgi:hypothetical protein
MSGDSRFAFISFDLAAQGFISQIVVFLDAFDDRFGVSQVDTDFAFQIEAKAVGVEVLGEFTAETNVDFEHGNFP